MAYGHSLKNMFLIKKITLVFTEIQSLIKLRSAHLKMRTWPFPPVFIWYLLYFMPFWLDSCSSLPLHIQPKSISLFLPTPWPPSLSFTAGRCTPSRGWVPPLPLPDITASLIHVLALSWVSPVSLLFPSLGMTSFLPSKLESNGFLSPSLYWHMFYLLMHFFFFLDFKSRIQTCKNIKQNGSKQNIKSASSTLPLPPHHSLLTAECVFLSGIYNT